MTAKIKISSALKMILDGKEEIEIEAGYSVRESMIKINIKPELIALVVVNGEQKNKDYIIKDGDQVKLLAVIGGG